MVDWLDLLVRIGPLLAGVTVPLVVLAVDARLRRRKQTVEEHVAEIVRADGRLDQLIARLEAENARLAGRLDAAEGKLGECERGREEAFAEIATLRERILAVERWHDWDGRERRRTDGGRRGG